LDKAEVELVRKTSQAPNSPMWTQFYGEGARKTAIKKLYKLLPQTDRMSTAIAAINEFDGLDLEKPNHANNIMSRFADAEEVDPILGKKKTGSELLQETYKAITDLAAIRGDTPDDTISALTSEKLTCLIDLETKSENFVNDLLLTVRAEIERAKGVTP
jgi:hypothetical protein